MPLEAPPRRILLTGASGLLGGELAGRLRDRGHRVTALVRGRRKIRRNDGRELPTADWPDADAARIGLLTGDITRPEFGLSGADAQAVAQAHDLIVHCAAATGFDLDPATYKAVNTDGTAHAVGLAARGGFPVLHVSTAYVCGKRDGPVAEEDLSEPVAHTNGYEASKAAAEAIVRRSGLPHAIARPSIIVGEHRSGTIRAFDTFYVVFRLLARGRLRRLPATAHASLDLVPIDHVSAGLVDLAERIEEANGRIFHLTSGAPVSVTRFRDAIAAWPHFHGPELIYPAHFDPAGLPASERRLHERVMRLYASYFQHGPLFLDNQARAFTGRICPPTDDAFLRRLAAYAIEAGFVPAEPPPA